MIDANLANRFGRNAPGASAEWRLLVVHSIMLETAEKLSQLAPASRELSVALTELQAAKLWALEAILCNQGLLPGANGDEQS